MAEEVVVVRYTDEGIEQVLARARELRDILDGLGGVSAGVSSGGGPSPLSGGAAAIGPGLVNTQQAAIAAAVAGGPLGALGPSSADVRQAADQMMAGLAADLRAGAFDALQRNLAGQTVAPTANRILAIPPVLPGQAAQTPLGQDVASIGPPPPGATVLAQASPLVQAATVAGQRPGVPTLSLNAAPEDESILTARVPRQRVAVGVGAGGGGGSRARLEEPPVSFAELEAVLAGFGGDTADVTEIRRLALERRAATRGPAALPAGPPPLPPGTTGVAPEVIARSLGISEDEARALVAGGLTPREFFERGQARRAAAGGGGRGALPPGPPAPPAPLDPFDEAPPPATPQEFSAARDRLAGRDPGRQAFSTFEIREEAARQRRTAGALVGAGGGAGGGGGDDDDDGQAGRAAGGRGRQQQQLGFADQFARTSFTPFILGITATQALAPFGDANRGFLDVNRQFGAFNADRARLDTQRLDADVRLGQQADEVQQQFDRIANSARNLAADGGLGRVNAVLGNLSDVANAVAGPIVAVTGAIGAARLLGASPAAIGGFGVAAGAAIAGGAAVGLAGTALESATIERTVRAFGPTDITAQQAAPAIGQTFQALFETLGARLIGRTREDVFPRQEGFIGPRDVVTPEQQLISAGASPNQAAIIERQRFEVRRAGTPFGADQLAAEQEEAQRAQASAGLVRSQAGIDIATREIGQSRLRLFRQQALEREQLEVQTDRGEEDIQIGFLRRNRDIDTGLGRQRREIGIRAGEAAEDVRIQSGFQRQDVRIQSGFQRQDLARQGVIGRREIGIGAGESREEIEIGAREGLQDILLGQVGGVEGQFLGLRAQRRRALARVGRDEQRALGRLGRDEGDAATGIGIGEDRALAGIGRDEERALVGIGRGATRAGAAAERGAGDAREDAGTARDDARFDLGTTYRRAAADMSVFQKEQQANFEAVARVQAAMLGMQQAELNARRTLVEGLVLRATDEKLVYDSLARQVAAIATSLEDVPRRINEAVAGMLEGATT